ncbi:hypothetical protein F5878DRAFT_645504 [Lentinula raphanica]|uniref:Uncharacterized protein n=1 Tax=Lentinula raphanica TaxID=153919 RepID=A0AA38P0C3_9AGAR|nr:hypothetical protein F5878DRAFT_645504 [Lentinula raphanica]
MNVPTDYAQSIDYVELLHPVPHNLNSIDLEELPWLGQMGPTRTPRGSRRSSPYPSPRPHRSLTPSSSPSPKRPLYSHSSSTPLSSSSSTLSSSASFSSTSSFSSSLNDSRKSDSESDTEPEPGSSNSNIPHADIPFNHQSGVRGKAKSNFAFESDDDEDSNVIAHEEVRPTASQQNNTKPLFAYESDEEPTYDDETSSSGVVPGSKGSKSSAKLRSNRVQFVIDKSRNKPAKGKQAVWIVESDDDDDGHIPKPAGEVGRPNRGGYNLCDALGWSKDEYRIVQKFINKAVEDHLVGDQPMKQQSLMSLKKVRDMAVKKFPNLKVYTDLWVVDDFIRSHLKYRKAALRTERLEKIAAKSQQQQASQSQSSRPSRR